jgi:hypothetical protein
MERLGVVDVPGKNVKLISRHQVVNKKVKREINHHQSKHPMSLQRSKYLCVDDNIEKEYIFKNLNMKSKGD